MVVNIEILRVIHWERSNLVQNMELRHVLLLVSHMGRLMANLRDIHWDMLLVQDLLLMADYMNMFLTKLSLDIY